MIEFDCPFCHKHYTFSDRFGGRAMFCTSCKAPLNVPMREDIPPRVVVPPPLPSAISALSPPASSAIPIESIPPPPPPPPLLPATTKEAVDDFGFIAHVIAEKQQDRQNTPLPSPPLLIPQGKEIANKLKTPKKSGIRFLLMFSVTLFLVVGSGLFLTFGIDWRGIDPRLEVLEKMNERKSQAIFEASSKETESNTLWLRSLENWNKAGEIIDSFIVTFGGNPPRTGGSESAAEQRLNDLHNMIQSAARRAVETEFAQETAIQDAKQRRTEIKFFTDQENELRGQIQRFPNDRTPVTMSSFVAEREPITVEIPLHFDTDWTENPFAFFDFYTEPTNQFYTVFDGIKRLYGRQSLRISILGNSSAAISFPSERIVTEKPIKRIKPENAGCFTFSICFPEVVDPIRIGKTADDGKIGEFRVRFVYPKGHIDFETVSPRYCEALFYDACGTYVPVEFPLSGDVYWKRTNYFDDPDAAAVNISNEPIDRIEIRLTPISDQTTFWLDGIALTEEISREPYDLLKAEARQTEVRKQDAFRSQQSVVNVARFDNDENLFQWVLQTARGWIHARQGNVTLNFNSQSQVPEMLEGMTIEEIDLTGFRRLTEGRLDQLGGLKTLKKLNLSRTGLKNTDLIKLATLTSLESLNLAGNELSFEGLPSIRTLRGLKELNLDDIKFSVNGIDAIAVLTSLRSLSLSRAGLDNSDLIYLLPLTEMETLDLSATKIGDNGIPILRLFTQLRSLNLSRTNVTDACLENLVRLKMLESVFVQNTAITHEGVRKIFGDTKLGCFKFTD